MYKNDKEHIFMDLQLGKQKRMMYARVFDRTEEETCSVDAVVPDALGDIGRDRGRGGHVLPLESGFFGQERADRGQHRGDVVYAEEGGALRSFPVELR